MNQKAIGIKSFCQCVEFHTMYYIYSCLTKDYKSAGFYRLACCFFSYQLSFNSQTGSVFLVVLSKEVSKKFLSYCLLIIQLQDLFNTRFWYLFLVRTNDNFSIINQMIH